MLPFLSELVLHSGVNRKFSRGGWQEPDWLPGAGLTMPRQEKCYALGREALCQRSRTPTQSPYDRQTNRPHDCGVTRRSEQDRTSPDRKEVGGLRQHRAASGIDLSLAGKSRVGPGMAAAHQ